MKLRDYTASKAVTLCFLGAGVMLLTIFLTAGGAAAPLVAMAAGCCVLLVSGWLVCGYLTERARLNRLERLINGLDEPYLLGELLPAPVNPVERYYYAAMKTVSRSAVGIAEAALREKEEYCAYVESWIHEIKTPLTACSLILANNADPRKLKRELKRADNLTETILYYARLRTAEKDMQVREIHAAHIMDDAVKSQMELLIAAGVSVSLNGCKAPVFYFKTASDQLRQVLSRLPDRHEGGKRNHLRLRQRYRYSGARTGPRHRARLYRHERQTKRRQHRYGAVHRAGALYPSRYRALHRIRTGEIHPRYTSL